MDMDSISFQSIIRPVGRNEFNKAVSRFGKQNFIDYPWTIKESVMSQRVYTTGIEDCTFFGLTDGKKVLGMHICPTMKANFDINKIKNFIKEKFDLSNPDLQGFILGGRRYSELGLSFNLFENLIVLFEKNNIPYSKFKGGAQVNDVAYDSTKDEWLISTVFAENEEIKNNYGAKEVLEHIFDEVAVSEKDEISW